MAFYTTIELLEMGFKSLGSNVLISKNASLYNIPNIEIGNNSRVDDFCILSAGENGIQIGSNVHIACYASLIGRGKIVLGDFSGVSSKSAIYSSNDDYSGNFLTGPTIDPEYTNVSHADVYVGRHVVIGTFSTILPGVKIHDGSAIGSYSLVNKDIEGGIIAAGVPAKKIRNRADKIFEIEKQYLANYKVN